MYAKDWQTKRETNPLMPVYKVRDLIADGDLLKKKQTDLNAEYGHVQGSKPQVLPEPREGVRNLQTEDIKGACAGSRKIGAFSHHQRKDEPRNLTQNEDIEGTKCGTVKKSIVTKRGLNPLAPEYQIPGRTECSDNMNDPYGIKGSSVAPKPPRITSAAQQPASKDLISPTALSSHSQKSLGKPPSSAHGSQKGSA